MSENEIWGKWDGTIWLRKHAEDLPFIWGGRCMYLEDITNNVGGFTVTTRANPRGGLERDTTRQEPPGDVTTTLVMKREKFATMKTELLSCYWDIDMRMMCGGKDRDNPYAWEEITRLCPVKVGSQVRTGSAIAETDADQMVTSSLSGFDMVDIYRISGTETEDIASLGVDVNVLCVTNAQQENCPGDCGPEEDCLFYAGTAGSVAAKPYILVNAYGGAPGQWTSVSVTEAANADNIEAILGFGDFLVATNNTSSEIYFSDDRGTTRGVVAIADAPGLTYMALDGTDASYMFVGCENGAIYQSTDAGRSWTQVVDGLDAASTMDMVRIAPDNRQVIYAATLATANIQKSDNGGVTWYNVGAIGAGTAASLLVVDQNTLLVGSAAGVLYQSTDGGVTFTAQTQLPGITAPALVSIGAMAHCGCGISYVAFVETGAGAASIILRNISGIAEGNWEPIANGGTLTATNVVRGMACCGPNHLLAVGGVALGSMAINLA